LLEKAEETPRVYSLYEMKSYKRVPVSKTLEDQEEKIYINLKPKDRIKILWEYEDIYRPTARIFVVVHEDGSQDHYIPKWSNKKMLHWVLSNAKELDV